MQRDRILRPSEVAPTTGVSTRTLQRWRKDGFGPGFVRVGKRAVGYFESDLVRWLEDRRGLAK
jgi:predicted DNA-binding transcriptional regulator AlpA